MDEHAFAIMRQAEESWWYRGRRLVVRSVFRAVVKKPVRTMLDFGAGFGAMYGALSSIADEVYAFEPESAARAVTEKRGYKHVFSTMEEACARKYEAVGAFDVVEHIEDDYGFLKKISDSLEDRGRLFITVPAYQFLWSKHDVANKHFRRYTKHSLIAVLEKTGYEIEYAGYWNTILFPLALLARISNKSGESAFGLPRPIDALFYYFVFVEAAIMQLVSLPFGVSVIAIARKKAAHS